MNGQEKIESTIIGTIKTIMKSRDFEVDIQPVGTDQLETILGKSKNGNFKIVFERNKIYVDANGQEKTFDNIWSKNFIKINSEIKNQCYGYRNTHYYRDSNGNWVRLPKKTGFFVRLFNKNK